MNFKNKINSKGTPVARNKLKILQVNMGDLCNQYCSHCHVDASPSGKKIMSRKIVDDILAFLSRDRSLKLDITGGCPELNPNFRYLVLKARAVISDIYLRTNLTVILEKGMKGLPEFYKRHRLRLIGSLPCYTKENVDNQRGNGVFDKSIKALKELNEIGYGKEDGLVLDLTFNPGGATLPPDQKRLEVDYKSKLLSEFGIAFNNLITLTNAPINRFRRTLERGGKYKDYMKLLRDNFNEATLENIMCRGLVSVSWDGYVYDCDFNQVLSLPIRDSDCRRMYIGDIRPEDLADRGIIFDDHCFSCTAGSGSSCQGALA